jgi:tRNA G18 (ribose-2'-O)-methylase SpoU
MSRVRHQYESQGFFGIGIVNNSDELNIGTLWRSAYILGASFIFTVDRKYQPRGSDVTRAWIRIPLYHYRDIDELKSHLPRAAPLIGVELCDDAVPLASFTHPDRAVYLLGNEQIGLSRRIIAECHALVSLPGHFSLNVAVAGSIVMYDRVSKVLPRLPGSGLESGAGSGFGVA